MAEISALTVTPQQLKTQAQEFKNKANGVKTTTKRMIELIDGITGATWSGEAAEKYKTRFKGLDDDMDKMVEMIKEYSNDLVAIAERYSTTEKSNEAIAAALAIDVL